MSSHPSIGTTTPQAKLEVVGAIRLVPSSAPTNPQEGMMYYDSNAKTFKCYVKTKGNPLTFEWQNCGGVREIPPAFRAGGIYLE